MLSRALCCLSTTQLILWCCLQAVYGTCKHGLRGWSLSCHEALRKHGVKVIVIEPGEGIWMVRVFAVVHNTASSTAADGTLLLLTRSSPCVGAAGL